MLVFSALPLPVVQHGDSLLVGLTVELAGSGVEVDVTAPAAQTPGAKKKGESKSVVLARLVRASVAARRSQPTVQLSAKGKRTLKRHKHLTLTMKITVTPPQAVTRTVTLEKPASPCASEIGPSRTKEVDPIM